MGGVEESAAVREGEVDTGRGGEETINVLGIVKSSKKRLPTACPLGEAEVVEVRRVERVEVDAELHERLEEDLKEDPA